MENKIRHLYQEIVVTCKAERISERGAQSILDAIFARCECGTPLFVKYVTAFPSGVTKIYCPDCLKEKEVFVED